jgi:hypothetical protein
MKERCCRVDGTMRRMLWLASSGVLAGLIAPVGAGASVLDVFERLAARGLSPPPLVPTKVPSVFRPLDTTLDRSVARRRDGYAVRLAHYTSLGPDAVIGIDGGSYRSIRAALRDYRGNRRRPIRIRGRRGFLVTSRGGPVVRDLFWSEGGRVYHLVTGTPEKVSLRQLRATAEALEPLRGYYIGGSSDPNKSSYGRVATTARTLTLYTEFNADCGSTPYAGQAAVTVVPLHGNTFSFDVARARLGSAPWTGSVSGTVGADAVTLQYQVSATIGGESCSGSETLTLPAGH